MTTAWRRGEYVYSDDDLLEDIQRVANEIGRSPTRDEYQRLGNHSGRNIQVRFGGWNAALETAGLETREPTHNHELCLDGIDEKTAKQALQRANNADELRNELDCNKEKALRVLGHYNIGIGKSDPKYRIAESEQ